MSISTPRLHHNIFILPSPSTLIKPPSNPTMRPATSLIRRNISSISSPAAPRLFHTCNAALKPNGASSEVGAASLSSRWLSELKATARANIKSRHQVERSKRVLDEVDARWVELLAGSEGFLSGPQWAGLSNDAVRWGDMVSRLRTGLI